ncbi:uncharacterized protein BBOV_IV005980 [Babesia bovis T2Bo]|uniref:Lon N-terminal domain-containing protein n=1 Tax=Babesia bovis TaxID=5865 RepID=A7AQZ0_BABBO|nr:uncharacterized protein BBOV_IV005980 [Babesia bovis T2Bo]EDO06959.1 hypothetical protein BBOV_IV005980 [Babesia bovis T2Bo]|eukprot:XP_001610527.1 hypothetical protein [Babesia bovis T2Bo]
MDIMGIAHKSTLIAVALAGILHINGLQTHYRSDDHGIPSLLVARHRAFINGLGVPHLQPKQRNRNRSQFAAESEEPNDESVTDEQPLRVHYDKEDHRTIHEELEKKSIEYIDNEYINDASRKLDNANNGSQDKESYFNIEKIRDNGNETSDEVVTSVDSTGIKEIEKGERPSVAGRGTDAVLKLEDYPTNVDTGRLNEWNAKWQPGEKVMSFFPIIVDEFSLLPSPLQLGFEDPVIFRGKFVDMTFNSLIDTMEMPNGDTKQIYGMCFINPSSGQLAPLAVYAELISREAKIDSTGEQLKVKGRVLGRVIIHKVLLEEPFIKAKIIPIEDDPKFSNAEEVPKIVDEITSIYANCNNAEREIMELLGQSYAVARIKERPDLHDLIDKRLGLFNVNLNQGAQAFAQIAAYTAFDYHLTANERYDALAMQNSFDRLRFVRDNLRIKLKQLNILKKAPKDKLEDIIEQMRQLKLNKDDVNSHVREGLPMPPEDANAES